VSRGKKAGNATGRNRSKATRSRGKKKTARKSSGKSSRKSTATARKETRQAKFLELFPPLWTITATAEAVGVTRRAVQKWLDEDLVSLDLEDSQPRCSL